MAKDSDLKVDYIHGKIDEVFETVHRIDKEVAAQKVTFDNHVLQDEKMSLQLERLNDILQQNTDSLKEHMLQTRILKEMVIKMDNRFTPIETKYAKDEIISEYRKGRKSKLKELLILSAKIIGTIVAVIGLVLTIKSLQGH